jgi:cobalt-zinc-cadmium efflux system outer membrane protein
VSHRLLPAIVATLIVVGTRPAHAQDAAIRTLDEAQFLAELEAANPRLERLAADIDAARAEILAAGARANPTLGLDREEVFPDAGSATNYARLTLPVDVSGRRSRRVEAARASAGAAAADAEITRLELVVEGLRVFHEAAYARLHAESLRADREALVRVVEIVRKRTSAGAASGYDLQRFELELATYDDLLVSADTALLVARARLAALVGKPRQAIDAGGALDLPATPAALASLLSDTLAQRGDVRAARLRVASAEARRVAAARAWIPDFGLSVGIMSADVGDETALGYTLGLALALPFFDRGQAERARAAAARRAAEADTRWLETQVPAAVMLRHATLLRRIEQAQRFSDEQLARLDALLKAAEAAYREGQSTVVELLDAYETARDTRLRGLELRRDARLAELDLWLALGRRP